MIRWAIDSGRVVRLARGVYIAAHAVPSDPVGRHLLLALALQVRSPGAIASHHTAALAWGLSLPDEAAAAASPASFIVPADPQRRARTIPGLHIALREIPAAHRTTHPSGLVTTTAVRTAVDVAAGCTPPEALITLDSYLHAELLGQVGERGLRRAYREERHLARLREPLVAAAGIAATQYTRGHLLEVVPLADPRRESPLESLSFGRFREAGLPLPRMQVPIETSEGIFHVDFLWEEARLIGEADGLGKYSSPDALVREKVRQHALELLGYRVVRWLTEEMTTRPGRVIARLAAHLDLGDWA
jgi:hypothetical protein